MDPSFHQEVQIAKAELVQTNHPQFDQDGISQQIHKAEEVFDQHMCDASPNLDFPKNRIFLLEVYAGNHSPLTDAVKALGLPSMRFTREDGDLSTQLQEEPNSGL